MVVYFKLSLYTNFQELDKWIKNHTKNPKTFEEYQGNIYKIVENEMGKRVN